MEKITLTILCNAVLLTALCLPAEAHMTIGLLSTAPFTAVTQDNADQLGKEFSTLAGEPVKIRLFENDAALNNWPLRFLEIDAAIVPSTFIRQNPAGALNVISDLHFQDSSPSPLALIVRSNLDNNKATQIKKAFLELGTSKDGRKALSQIGLAGASLPGKPLSQKKSTTKPLPAQKVEKQPTPAPLKPVPAKETQTGTKQISPPAEKSQSTSTVDKPTLTMDTQLESAAKEQPAKQAQVPATESQKDSPTPDKEAAKTSAPEAKSKTHKRLTLFIVLVIFAAILLKACLFILRWKKTRESSFRPEETPVMDSSIQCDNIDLEETTPAEPTEKEEDAIIEEGRLGPGKVPQLLKRCADMPRPVVLHITKGSCKKLVYFAGGQVSGALTQHSTINESEVRWNKLGNLLVREGLITAEDRDHGMALLAKEPELRFGEALLKLGLIELAELRHALTRQAKVTIYSLILYPEGRYQVYAGDGALPPEESVALEITTLIREASHHQTEWASIRETMPNLNTSLEFCSDGRNKLEKVSLSHQQEETLSYIDGNRTINEICIASSMMD